MKAPSTTTATVGSKDFSTSANDKPRSDMFKAAPPVDCCVMTRFGTAP